MLPRLLGWLVVAVATVVGAILLWPQAFGLNDQWIAAHVVALRGTAALVAVAAAVLFGTLGAIRAIRTTCFALALVLVVFALGNAAVLVNRGLGSATPGAGPDDAITVLSWNTYGEVPDPQQIVDLAVDEGADIVVLPETTGEVGEEVAVRMGEAGSPMWVHSIAFDEISKARSTTLLVSPALGDYRVVSPEWPGPPDNTNTLPTVVAESASGDGPTIVAAHAVAPIRWELRNWRSDLDWLASLCDGDEGDGDGDGDDGVIMAGDFNATLDHFAGRGVDGGDLGRCRDAADVTGAAGLGTWPSWAPELLGSPIDHVLATPDWRAVSFRVVGELDGSGSDHRPVVATFVRAG
ncbi:endonuclease/exonuclease/phosphatase family protein [Agromyces sp. MMS24-JH15]|uniref:endonuclease/exonuclease/phosphatase family protein n=1 Tax=Agromyces sp. MMS24-JH15 TaxID=3243765 RepID=UPI00374873B4